MARHQETRKPGGRPMAKQNAFGEWVNLVGTSRVALAKELGLKSRQHLDRLCCGERLPSFSLAKRIYTKMRATEKTTGRRPLDLFDWAGLEEARAKARAKRPAKGTGRHQEG